MIHCVKFGLIFFLIHLLMVFFLNVGIKYSADNEAGMLWYFFYWLDMPLAIIFPDWYFQKPFSLFAGLGSILWLTWGLVLGFVLKIKKNR